MILLRHPDPGTIEIPRVEANQLRLCALLGLDHGLVLGIDEHTQLLMPHGGIAIVRAISTRLEELGVPIDPQPDPVLVYPEARSEIEAWCLHALSLAPSPMAVDVLMRQNERWATLGASSIGDVPKEQAMGAQNASALDRLLHPPIVAAVGRANVGKSSLINTLAGQRVALVSDTAGTTRDHVGVPVDLGGLVVRWVDTPGVDERMEDTGELAIVQAVLRGADLIVHCIDAINDPGKLDDRLLVAISADTMIVRAGTRSDLGEHACPVDVRVSVGARGGGIAELVSLLRGRLLPETAFQDPQPWRFWSSLRAEA